MKKRVLSFFLVAVVVAVLVVAASAFAFAGYRDGRRNFCPMFGNRAEFQQESGMYGQEMMRRGEREGARSLRGSWKRGNENIPEEIRTKMTEMIKIRHEMALAYLEDTVDKEKVRSLFEKQLTLRNDISRWHFEQRLNAPRPEKN